MTYAAPPNFVAGQVVTEANLDTLSGDISWLYAHGPQQATSFPGSPATDDLCFRTDQRILYRYTGSAWEAIAWRAIGARVYNSANISVANNTVQALTFDSERYDTDSIHSTSSNTSRLVAPFAGTYLIAGTMRFASNATGIRAVQLRLNGGTLIGSVVTPPTSGDVIDLNVVTVYALAASDYVELCAYQTSGGALNAIAAANFAPEFILQRIG